MVEAYENQMCSNVDCTFRGFYDIDGKHYCKFHNPIELGVCGVIQKNGSGCPCPARRSRKGVHTCLVHVPKSSEITSCSICLEDVPIGTKPTKCGHVFHRQCMIEWKKQANGHTCPMCRVVLCKPAMPSENLLARITQIAHSSMDVETFMANIIASVEASELEMVINVINTF